MLYENYRALYRSTEISSSLYGKQLFNHLRACGYGCDFGRLRCILGLGHDPCLVNRYLHKRHFLASWRSHLELLDPSICIHTHVLSIMERLLYIILWTVRHHSGNMSLVLRSPSKNWKANQGRSHPQSFGLGIIQASWNNCICCTNSCNNCLPQDYYVLHLGTF